jgi:serine/threonine protein kinase
MAHSRAGPLPGVLLQTGDDLLDFYQLRSHFSGPFVEHHRYFSDPSRRIRNHLEVQRWARLRELGSGAFGRVFLEREENSGRLRAVKELAKAKYKAEAVDYLREILAMANLSRV